MFKRENLIMIGVFGVAAFMVVYFIGGGIYGAFNTKHSQLAQAEKDLAERQKTETLVKAATNRLKLYEARALPFDPNKRDVLKSKTLYQNWLIDLMKKHQIADPVIQSVPPKPHKNFQVLSYRLTGQTDLVKVTELLYDFYAVNYLHRIGRISLRPAEQKEEEKKAKAKKMVEMELNIEVLAMAGAPDLKALPTAEEKPSKRLTLEKDAAGYVAAITGRNVFDDPHNAPTISVAAESEYVLGSNVTFKATGKDPEGTAMVFSLDKNNLAGARIDPKSGNFTWAPKEAGNYEVMVRASDSGTPAKSATKLVKFAVKAPKIIDVGVREVPPPFDHSKHTHLSAVIAIDGQSQAWFDIRTQNRVVFVKTGDALNVGDLFKSKVVAIGRDDVELELADGKHVLVTRGSTLHEGHPLPSQPREAPTAVEAAPAAVEAGPSGE